MTRVPVRWIWCALALLAVLAFLHLGADMPHHSPWADDPARFTDEGWYASGAIRQVMTGRWLQPGDFNPVVTIPVWSALLAAVFHIAGVSLVAARVCAVLMTFGSIAAMWLLLRRQLPQYAWLGALLLASSPILFFFSRTAILEPALICSLLWAAFFATRSERPASADAVLTGVLFAVAMLVKSSALFVGPALIYLVVARQWRAQRWRSLRLLVAPMATAITIFGLYWLLVIRPHAADFQVLVRENVMSLEYHSIEKMFRIPYRTELWVAPLLFPIAIAASLALGRSLWRQPLFGFAVLWFVGYAFFMVVHYDAGPRYFAVLAVPIVLVIVLMLNTLREERPQWSTGATGIVAGAILLNLIQIGWLMTRVSYSFVDAAHQIAYQIKADRTHTPLVIGHGAIETTLVTHIPALDDLGTESLEQKLALQHPGWVVTYSDGAGIVTSPEFLAHDRATLVGSYPVFDQPNRPDLQLYRIDPR
jgi:4-amino-4-deoxy-L-arabinose transferase-like glycosyltransferase